MTQDISLEQCNETLNKAIRIISRHKRRINQLSENMPLMINSQDERLLKSICCVMSGILVLINEDNERKVIVQ